MPPPNTPEEGLITRTAESLALTSISAPPATASSPPSAPRTRATSPDPNNRTTCPSRDSSDLLEIDYQILEYIDSVDETLLCPVCRTPFYSPITTTCGHTFCAGCINRALEVQPTCPIDRQPINKTRDYHRPPLIVKDQLDRLKVKCPNRGCEHICSREHLNAHYERRCEYTLVRCPDPWCNKRIARRHVSPASACMHREVSCRYCEQSVPLVDLNTHYDYICTGATTKCSDCDATVVLHRLEKHRLDDCPETIIRCKWHIAGCKVDDKRRTVLEHEDGCPYEIIGQLVKERAEDRKTIENLTDRLLALETERNETNERRARRREQLTQRSTPSSTSIYNPPRDRMTQDELLALEDPLLAPHFVHNNHHNNPDDLTPTGEASSSHPSRSSTWVSPEDYMLARFERLEARMEDLSKQFLETDAHQSMNLLQQTMALNQQLVELGSKVGVLSMHTNWLMNMQRHKHFQQRAGAVAAAAAAAGFSSSVASASMNPPYPTSMPPQPPIPSSATDNDNNIVVNVGGSFGNGTRVVPSPVGVVDNLPPRYPNGRSSRRNSEGREMPPRL